jgi:Fe-S oxidoreductase
MAVIPGIAPKTDEAPAIILDDDRWQQVLEATGGWAAACYQCGLCSAVCPWGQVRSPEAPPVSVRQMVRAAQLGLSSEALPAGAPLWLCTTCRACEVRCPRGVPVTDVVLGLRELAWKEPWLAGQAPPALAGMLWDIHWDGNPWGRPPSQRTVWSRDLALPDFDPTLHEALYYVGCTAAYDRRSQHVARALVNVLRTAGVTFGTLGETEPCCGDAARSVGQRGYFGEMVEVNSRLFRERAGVSAGPDGDGHLPKREGGPVLVTTSPHCYDTLRNHYPALQDVFRPLHYTQYLAELVEAGRLSFPSPLSLRVTFHDPCVLGRGNDEYEAPRRVLQAIPGVEVVEMASNRAEALCCGGGGGRMWLETAAEERFGKLRVNQAHQTGASTLATACPYCISCLEDALKVEASAATERTGDAGKTAGTDTSVMRVLDIAEIAWQALSATDSGNSGSNRPGEQAGR